MGNWIKSQKTSIKHSVTITRFIAIHHQLWFIIRFREYVAMSVGCWISHFVIRCCFFFCLLVCWLFFFCTISLAAPLPFFCLSHWGQLIFFLYSSIQRMKLCVFVRFKQNNTFHLNWSDMCVYCLLYVASHMLTLLLFTIYALVH